MGRKDGKMVITPSAFLRNSACVTGSSGKAGPKGEVYKSKNKEVQRENQEKNKEDEEDEEEEKEEDEDEDEEEEDEEEEDEEEEKNLSKNPPCSPCPPLVHALPPSKLLANLRQVQWAQGQGEE